MKAGTLEIEMIANLARLQQDLDQARKVVAAMGSDVGRTVRAANDNFASLGKGAGAGLGQLSRDMSLLRAELDPIGVATARYNRELEMLNAAVERGKLSQREYAIALEQAKARLDEAANRHSAFAVEAREMAEAEARAAKEAAELSASAEALLRKIDPLHAAQAQFNAELAEADRLLAAGVLAEHEYSAAVDHSAAALRARISVLNGSAEAAREAARAEVVRAREMAEAEALAAKETAELGASAEALRRKIDPLYAAQAQFNAELAEADRLLAAGVLAEREYGAAVDQSTAALRVRIGALDGSADAAREAARAEQELARQTATYASQADALRSQLDPMFAAQQRFNQTLDQAEDLLKREILTEREYVAVKKLATQALQDHAQAVARSNAGAVNAMNAVTASTGAQRQGLQQLGMQGNDIITMWNLGAKPAQIFASQIGQVTQAAQMMVKEGSKLGTFLAGPWGVALSLAIIALAPFIAKLFETKDVLDDVGRAADSAMAKLQQSLQQASAVSDASTDAIKRMITAQAGLAQANREIAEVEASANKSQGWRLIQAQQEKIKHTRDLQKAQADLTQIQQVASTIIPIQTRNQERLNETNDRGAGATAAHTSAVSDQQKAYDDALRSADEYIKSLQREVDDFGKTEKQLREEEVARRMVAAATDEQRAAIALLSGKRENQLGAKKLTDEMAQAAKWRADSLADIDKEIALLGLAGAARERAALELEKEAFIAEAIKNNVLDAASAWEEYHGKQLKIIDAQAELEAANKLVDHFGAIADAANDAARSMQDAFGDVGGTIGDVIAILGEYGVRQASIQAQVVARTKTQAEAERELAGLQLDSLGKAFSVAKSLFKEHSAGYKAMAAAEKALAAFRAVEAAKSVAQAALDVAAGAAKIFSFLGPFAFPAVAAMMAVMTGLGFKGGGSSGYRPPTAEEVQAGQGTGSVLGDSEAKSGSIANALDLMLKNSNKDLEYSNDIVRSLRAIETNIGALTGLLARQLNLPGGSFDTSSLGLGSGTSGNLATNVAQSAIGGGLVTLLTGVANPIGLLVGTILTKVPVIGDLLGGIAKALFGTKKTVTLLDQGLTFAASNVEDIINGGLVGQIYQDVSTQTKKKMFGITTSNKTKVTTSYGELDNDMERQVALIIGSLKSGILDAASVLGVQGAEAALNAFSVNLGKISLKDLKGDEIQEALEAVFGKLGDDMAAAALPALTAFQQVGEGLFETLARLAKDYAAVDIALTAIGMSFGSVGMASVEAREGLIDLFGGLDEFVEQTNFFRENFLTEAEQMAPIISAVQAEMARLGQSGVDTRDEFKQLVLGLDLSSESGAEMYASLMAVAPAFSKVIEYLATLDEALEETGQTAAELAAIAKQRRGLEIELMEALGQSEAALQAKRADTLAGLDATLRALQQQVWAAQEAAAANAALAQAQEAAAAVAKAIADEAAGIERQILEARGDTEALRDLELAGLNEANRARMEYLYGLRDEIEAQEAAAQAAADAAAAQKAIADEAYGLQTQWLQLIGDEVSLRQRALELLNPANRAKQQEIWAYQDMIAALEKQKEAQQALIDQRQGEIDGINDTIDALSEASKQWSDMARQIREFRAGIFEGTAGSGSTYATAQAEFERVSRMAALGDGASLESFTGVSQTYLDASKENAGSIIDYRRTLGLVAAAADAAALAADDRAKYASAEIIAMYAQRDELIALNEQAQASLDTLTAASEVQANDVVPTLEEMVAQLKADAKAASESTQDQRSAEAQLAGRLANIESLLESVIRNNKVMTGSDDTIDVKVTNSAEEPVPVV